MLVIADVAGGQGELAFELLNLNGIPATVLEPRQLELQKRCKRLLVSRGLQLIAPMVYRPQIRLLSGWKAGLRTGHLLPQAL